MKITIDKLLTAILVLCMGAFMISFTSCSSGDSSVSKEMQAKVDSLQNELKKFTDEKARYRNAACKI